MRSLAGMELEIRGGTSHSLLPRLAYRWSRQGSGSEIMAASRLESELFGGYEAVQVWKSRGK